MKYNLIMPMAGGGTRFLNNNFEMPKPLIEIYGKPFLYWSTKSITNYLDIKELVFVVLQEHVDNFHIDSIIKNYFPDSKIVVLDHVLDGAVLTCNEGVKVIDNDYPIIFNDCDHLFLADELYNLDKFVLDGAILTFKSDKDCYSYVSYDELGFVNRTVEKEVISDDAICGAYLFKNKDIYLKYALEYLKNCMYKEFFMSGVYNEMIKDDCKIVSLKTDEHVSFGTPLEYEEALNNKVYKRIKLK